MQFGLSVRPHFKVAIKDLEPLYGSPVDSIAVTFADSDYNYGNCLITHFVD